jgi:RHS repeat-associated protein
VALYIRNSTGTPSTQLFTLTQDHLGSIDTLVQENGSATLRLAYDAYGDRRDPTTGSGEPTPSEWDKIYATTHRGYTEHEHLDDFQMLHMNGRILSADPFIPNPRSTQDYNRYSYVNNNPLRYIDPSGFCPGSTDGNSQVIDRAKGGGCPDPTPDPDNVQPIEPPDPGAVPPPTVPDIELPATVITGTTPIPFGMITYAQTSSGRGRWAPANANAVQGWSSYIPGTEAGDEAAMHWAEQVNASTLLEDPLARVGLLLSVLWTPDTAVGTFLTLVGGGAGSAGVRSSIEFTFGKNFRIAPFGNRTGHALGELPHYHRRVIDAVTGKAKPGQGIGRHRPWETKSTDKSFWDLF